MLSQPTKTLLALLALSSFTSAGWFDDQLNAIVQRQDTNPSNTASTTPIPTPPPDTESTTPSATPSATPTPTPTPTPSESTTPSGSTSPTPTPTPSVSATPTPTPSSSSTVDTNETTTPPPTTKKETSATTTWPPVTKINSLTITITRDNGEVVTQTSESTAITTPTSAAEAKLAADGSGTKNGDGMSPSTKRTVIGVVVGIGGAILLAGLAVVAWRIWGRKKNGDDGDDLMEYNRPDTVEKSGSSGGSSNPFQSTLENYHNPAKQVNASSNF